MNRWTRALLGALPAVVFLLATWGLVEAAAPTLAWLGRVLAFPWFVIQHWNELSTSTKALVVGVVLGFVLGVGLILATFRFFVWRSWFPDFSREDEHGNRTRYGRAFFTQTKGETSLVWFRWNGKRALPWQFHRLETTEAPRRVGPFSLVVSARAFEPVNVTRRQWQAVMETERTTLLVLEPFREQLKKDLELKKRIAKEGAQGHLGTQRQKALNNRMDTTAIRPGEMKRRRDDLNMVRLKPKDPLAAVAESSASVDGGAGAPVATEDEE